MVYCCLDYWRNLSITAHLRRVLVNHFRSDDNYVGININLLWLLLYIIDIHDNVLMCSIVECEYRRLRVSTAQKHERKLKVIIID